MAGAPYLVITHLHTRGTVIWPIWAEDAPEAHTWPWHRHDGLPTVTT
jgi:hypothetical protein